MIILGKIYLVMILLAILFVVSACQLTQNPVCNNHCESGYSLSGAITQ